METITVLFPRGVNWGTGRLSDDKITQLANGRVWIRTLGVQPLEFTFNSLPVRQIHNSDEQYHPGAVCPALGRSLAFVAELDPKVRECLLSQFTVEETYSFTDSRLPCFSAAGMGFAGKGVDPRSYPHNLWRPSAFPSPLLQEHSL